MTKPKCLCYTTHRWLDKSYHHNAAVAQSVERRIGSAEVTGPIPVSSLLNPQWLLGILFYVIGKYWDRKA